MTTHEKALEAVHVVYEPARLMREAASIIESQAARIAALEAGLDNFINACSSPIDGKWLGRLYVDAASLRSAFDAARSLIIKDRQP